MRGINCRCLRLELVAGVSIALAMLLSPLAAVGAQAIAATTTTMTTQASTAQGCALTTLAVNVVAASGTAAGTVTIADAGNATPLASGFVNSSGQAGFVVALTNGPHSLTAAFNGGALFQNSTSAVATVTTTSQCDSSFVVTVSSLSPSNTLTAGQSGTATVTVTPIEEFASSLAAPAFVTISCSGLPDQSSCTFTPENVELLPGTSAGVTSSMVIGTQAASGSSASLQNRRGGNANPVAWAFLFPGALALGGLAWGSRRRRWLSRLSLVVLVSLVTLMSTTACNSRYGYEHHGPGANLPTPVGNYTVKIAAQSTNGVTAVTQTTTMSLIVQ